MQSEQFSNEFNEKSINDDSENEELVIGNPLGDSN